MNAAARADGTIDQEWERYTAAEHGVWHTLFERQTRLLGDRACRQFIAGMQALPLEPRRIPDFRRLSEVLHRRTGWEVVAVPGLIPDGVFFEHLANRRFPSGNFIRKPHQLDYLEEPDVFHDVFGHVPMLMDPVMADFIQAYGRGGLRAQALGTLEHLARVYWYTVEFGLVREAGSPASSPMGSLRLYGAGLASSFTEASYCLESPAPQRLRFDLERVMRTRYRIDDFQETYFVLDSIDDLLALAQIDFAPLYARIKALPELNPTESTPGDRSAANSECLGLGSAEP